MAKVSKLTHQLEKLLSVKVEYAKVRDKLGKPLREELDPYLGQEANQTRSAAVVKALQRLEQAVKRRRVDSDWVEKHGVATLKLKNSLMHEAQRMGKKLTQDGVEKKKELVSLLATLAESSGLLTRQERKNLVHQVNSGALLRDVLKAGLEKQRHKFKTVYESKKEAIFGYLSKKAKKPYAKKLNELRKTMKKTSPISQWQRTLEDLR